MQKEDFPLILSPNLGCPRIIPENEIEKGIEIIIAGQYGEYTNISKEMFEGVFKLVPSFKENKIGEISLVIDEIEELTGWNRLFDFSSMEDTQHLINSELHYNVLGENTRYWLIKTKPSKMNDILKIEKGKKIPTLYDLEFIEKFSEKPEKQEKSDTKTKLKQINYHAVQFVETFSKGLNFIHLTDLHIAQRNDEILEEVLKIEHEDKMGLIETVSSFFSKKQKEKIRSRKEIRNSYINFNNNFRELIHKANDMARLGKLDFIVITGDIVDFAGLGWYEEIGPAENNWKIFIDIVTGKGNEDKTDFWSNISNKEKDKPGLNIAIFTSSGNHDWRMHPGSLLPYVGEGECKKFGLTEVEAKNYNYKSFDSSEFPSDEMKKMSDALFSKILIVFEKKWWAQYIPGLLVLIGITIKVPEVAEGTSIKYLIFGVLLIISGFFLKKIVRKIVDFIVDNPAHAVAKALHYYFKHINPYFDYAFSFGKNHFILMDTGVDAITVGAKELMDAKDTKYLKKVSVMDNAIGMSPDSMAFDDRQAFYNWSQIVWLDKVLTGISKNKNNTKENIIICVHAPPLNFDYKYKTHLKALSESLRRTKSSPKYVEELSELGYIFNSILIKYKLIKIKTHLFNWNDVPETNNRKFIEFLKNEYAFEFEWVKEAQIEKINNGNAIKVSNGQNQLLLKLNDKKTEVELTINSIRTDILIAKSDENKLRIYKNNMNRINLTYGTINHYLSQFFFLCRGLHENPNRRIEPDKESELRKVDLVLSGHAHIGVEFRIDIEPENQEKKVRIYHDEYSTEYPDNFYDSETFFVQTAACGPHGDDADSPPYWRMITINKENRITSFKQENLKKIECPK